MRNVCFRLVGGVPVIGPLFDDCEAARRAAKQWLHHFNKSYADQQSVRVLIEQEEYSYSLVILVNGRVLYRLAGLDELLVRRLYRAVAQKRLLVLTSFVDEGSVEPRPLAVTEGIGLVVFQQEEVI
ncbi:MAG: hypothetical protein C4570_00585 [Ammonifex sp.]|nr:MAG: hypothetical protein C4570_00585 [Ammonifex sp.]